MLVVGCWEGRDVPSPAANKSGRSADRYAQDGKHRGMNVVARSAVSPADLESLLVDNVEWIALGPFGWQDGLRSPTVHMNTEMGFWGERDAGIIQIANVAHARGMHVLLKPQLWLRHGNRDGWLDAIDPGSPDGWAEWFGAYDAFILHYAALAETCGIEVFCVGAELHTAVTQHPEAWRALIDRVRSIYHGRLTYAANWHEEVSDVSFWDALDFIGVQAYYPLADGPNPSVEAMMHAWKPVCASLEALSGRYKKPVLFTEVGWKSTADGAVRPWEWTEFGSGNTAPSLDLQADAYEAFFRSVWPEPWFAGAYFWKWYTERGHNPGMQNVDFTPQRKPAEAVLARGYGRLPSS